MDLIKIMEMFPDQSACITYLEQLRWQGSPECPHCASTHVNKRNETAIGRIDAGIATIVICHSTFVTSGTMFAGTKIALQKWFLAIALMANAKKSLSSCQLARYLGLKQKTAWRMMMCIRAEMEKDNVLLQGIVEADETYIGGSNRKDNDKEEDEPRKHGRGTAKDADISAVARGGKVVAELVSDIAGEQSQTSLRGLSISMMRNSIPTSLKVTTS